MKVTDISDKRKPADACQFCGQTPACPALTCPKVARIELFDDGSLAAVEYFDPGKWQPLPKGDETPVE